MIQPASLPDLASRGRAVGTARACLPALSWAMLGGALNGIPLPLPAHINPMANEPIQPIPPPPHDNPELPGLGHKRLHEVRLSVEAENPDQQISYPIHAGSEMDSGAEEMIHKPNQDPALRQIFKDTLVTPNSFFDRWLQGDATVINQPPQMGYQLFEQYDCAKVHQGLNVGGNRYQYLGLVGNYFAAGGEPIAEADPGLRMAARIGPCFHDASEPGLEEAIIAMGCHHPGPRVPTRHVHLTRGLIESLAWPYQPLIP